MVAWRRVDEVPKGAERPWLYGIARKVLANQRRSGERRLRLADKARGVVPGQPFSPEEVLLRHEEVSQTVAALWRLRPIDREILLLSFWEELRPPQISQVLGLSRAAVDQRFSRAKRRIARELNRGSSGLGSATPKLTRKEVTDGSDHRETNSGRQPDQQ